jgi:hypothetical protein
MPSEESKLVDLLHSVHDQATTLNATLVKTVAQINRLADDQTWTVDEYETYAAQVADIVKESLELAQRIENRP